MSARARLWTVMAALFGATVLVGLWGTAGHAVHQGDEAIYAQMGREIAEKREWIDLTWQGELRFPRPPMAFWTLAVAHAGLGDERAVRWVNAGAQGLVAAATVWLGASLTGVLAVGAAAAAMLTMSDLFIGYSRFFESEPILCTFVVIAFAAYASARRRSAWIYLWGGALGGALMTKQLVGALPLLAPIVDRLARPEGGVARVRMSAILRGLLATLLVAAPWHIAASLRHGSWLWESMYLSNVVARSMGAMHQSTSRLFYFRELWRSEGALAIGIGLAVVLGILRGARSRRFSDLLLASWVLGVVAVYSLAASRYDYYLLLAYPAFFLLVAEVLMRAGTFRPELRAITVGAWLLVASLSSLPRYIGSFRGEDEVRTLVTRANSILPSAALLYTYNTLPYAARYYSTHDLRLLLESEADFRQAQALKVNVIPLPVELAPDLAKDFALRAKPFALLMPTKRAALLDGIPGLSVEGSTAHYLLVIAR